MLCRTTRYAELHPTLLFHMIWMHHMLIIVCHVQTPGFIRFALLRGDEAGDYISQSTVR